MDPSTRCASRPFFAQAFNTYNRYRVVGIDDTDTVARFWTVRDRGITSVSLSDTMTERRPDGVLTVLIAHLLKGQFQPSGRGNSWRDTISTQRMQIARHMKRNPSLKAKLDEAVEDAHADARVVARQETGLEPEMFPLACPYSWAQIMEHQLLPE